MGKLWIGVVAAAELFLSIGIHFLYGFYIFSSAVAPDLSQTISGYFWSTSSSFQQQEIPMQKEKNEGDVQVQAPPIVLVHGIFGFGKGKLGGLSYFGGAEEKDHHVLVPDLGSLTSIHDRARELFYHLKGGKVDYGDEHSRAFGHSRFGKNYDRGNYPEWDSRNPVHFVGHSAGAQVVRLLQQMLADKAFEGYDTSEDWVLSLTSLSGAFNGTTRTYLDGMQPEDGKSLKPMCLLQFCRVGAILYDWLDIPWLKRYYNFGFDHFGMSRREIGLAGLIDCLVGNTGPFATGDWILPDLTIQGSMQMNSTLRTFPNTYYFSYATKRTMKFLGLTVPSSLFGIHPIFFLRVLQMCFWNLPPDVTPPYKGYRDEDWHDNDGALNTISMTHPRVPMEHPSLYVSNDSDCHPWLPGIWYYKILEADHIFFILNRDRAGMQFDLMYDSIFQRCRKHAFRIAPPTLPTRVK